MSYTDTPATGGIAESTGPVAGGASATAADRDAALRFRLPVAATTFVISATLSVLDRNSLGEAFVDLGLELVAAVVLFVLLAPRVLRKESAGGLALVLGLVAALLVIPAFWSGLPLILGSAAALLGWAGRRSSRRGGLSVAAFAVGLLAVISYAAVYVLDTVTH